MACSSEVEEIMSGPLVQWLASCLDDPKRPLDYNDLVDGVLIYEVFLQIDPEPLYDGILATSGDARRRSNNLEIIVKNLKRFYEDELGQLIIKEPKTRNLGEEPLSNVEEARLILLLLLGCAVQCPNKEKFIMQIKNLDLDVQLKIVDCIKQITDKSDIVIARETFENANITGLFEQIRHLLRERDTYREKWGGSSLDDVTIEIEDESGAAQSRAPSGKTEREKNHHSAVELADWKSKLRKQRQRLDEKAEALLECKDELERVRASLAKVKQENFELTRAARTVQSYKDELDAMTERAERADRLELEVQRYRQKLTDLEFYKTWIEELSEENRVLNENREMLEEQSRSSRRNAEKVKELQAQIIGYEKLVNEMSLEQSAQKENLKELLEENGELHRLQKAAANEAAMKAGLGEEGEEPAGAADKSLSEQLTNSAQARMLKLELENQRLMAMMDSFEEKCFYATTSPAIRLHREKEINELSMKIHSLSVDKEHLSHSNCDLEVLCREALEENKKLQSILNDRRNSFEIHREDYQSQREKIVKLENHNEMVCKEKEKIQLLLESAQRRADDLERLLEMSNQRLEELKAREGRAMRAEAKCYELENKLTISEKEKNLALGDVGKMRVTIENKDMALDRSTNNVIVLERKVEQLEGKIKNFIQQISRLEEVEKLYNELSSKLRLERERAETLESNLNAEKLNGQRLTGLFEKLGLNVESLLNLPVEKIIESIGGIPEVVNYVKCSVLEGATSAKKNPTSDFIDVLPSSTIKDLQEIIDAQKNRMKTLLKRIQRTGVSVERLKLEKTRFQMPVTKLSSSWTSWASGRTNLHSTETQLASMKMLICKERARTQLENDRASLQSLHDQLNTGYDNILRERESLRKSLREAQNAIRKLERETGLEVEKNLVNVSKESGATEINTKNLNTLRVEHAKLEEDFMTLYTSTQKLRVEHDNLKESYKKVKIDLNRVSLKQTEMEVEMNLKNDKCTALELEISKLNQSSEMLLQVNSGLESTRRSLMNHLSLLFNQYHELLIHSFEDKEHYHMEEKLYTDKVNHLHRQKEKLEEKIMDHYKRLENCSMKKKKFGANLVKKVRKAGSELLSMNRRSWAEDTMKQLENNKTYESESGGNESDWSIDFQHESVTELGKSAVLEDKICRWVIEKH
ncbi:protein Daple-like isoform X2 [Venturia canescens]|uniref:protein Daple-like isoform X2 n=1 Tax=Venturia canescens TaxID=32260 RepID=UPI001C9BFB08|nr:protein Daple-like isoform X2 [Venturia canescens]